MSMHDIRVGGMPLQKPLTVRTSRQRLYNQKDQRGKYLTI